MLIKFCDVKCVLLLLWGIALCGLSSGYEAADETRGDFNFTKDLEAEKINIILEITNEKLLKNCTSVKLRCTDPSNELFETNATIRKIVNLTLENLKSETTYSCNFAFVPGKDLSSQKFEVMTRTKLPVTQSLRINSDITKPTIISKNVTSHSAKIVWFLGNSTDGTHRNLSISCIDNRKIPSDFNFPTNSSILTINLTDLSAESTYNCNASINGDRNSTEIFHFETQKDDFCLELRIIPSATTIFLQWNQTLNYEYSINIEKLRPKHFVPSYCDSENNHTVFSKNVEGSNFSYTDAFPDYEYKINVTALNNKKIVNGMCITEVSTKRTAPKEVRNLQYKNTTHKYPENFSFNISWQMPCYPNGNITGYQINLYDAIVINNSSVPEHSFPLQPTNLESTELTYELQDLKASRNYFAEVAAFSGNLIGNWTRINFTTPSLLPPPEVRCTSNTRLISVDWSVGTKNVDEIVNWFVKIESLGANYWQPDGCIADNHVETRTPERNERNTQFSDLKPYTKYNITVAAETAVGLAGETTETCVTFREAPPKVENIHHTFTNSGYAFIETNITWDLPCLLNGPLDQTEVVIVGKCSNEYENEATPGEDDQPLYVKDPFVVTKLKYSYTYTISIYLMLDEKQKGYVAYDRFSTHLKTPGEVSSLDVVPNNDSFQINWKPPKERGCLKNYKIAVIAVDPAYNVSSDCNEMPKNHSYDSMVVNNTITNVSFSLKPMYHYYNYKVVVKASSDVGSSEPNSKAVISLPSVPEAVEDYDAKIDNNIGERFDANATIVFKPSCYLNGPLLKYTLVYDGVNQFNAGGGIHNEVNVTDHMNRFEIKLKQDYMYRYFINTYTNGSTARTCYKYIEAQAGAPKMNIVPDKISIEKTESSAKLSLDVNSFDQVNGELRFIALLLTNSTNSSNEVIVYPKEKDSEGNEFPLFSEEDKIRLKALIKEPFKTLDIIQLHIGNGNQCPPGFKQCREPLESNKDYYVVVRAFTTSYSRNSPVIHFKTERLKTLDVILGTLFGILFAILSAFVVFYLYRKKIIKIPNLPTIPILAQRKAEQVVPIRSSYPPKKFVSYCKHLEDNPDILKQQFTLIKEKSAEFSLTLKTQFAKLTENRRKNRYTNISPFDETRVKLMIDEDDEIGSDYINASYIRGYTGEVEYIATQGPLESTCRDFWKMILQENVSMIVMVSLFIEQEKVKCHKYFPKNHETMLVGEDIEIKCCVEFHFGIYCVRTLQIRKDNFQTHITHMQFLGWPDFGTPTGTEHMLQFCYQIRDKIEIEEGIIVVHCSAGVGRTGTLIATDILLQTANAGRNIDVYSTVEELRRQRMNMVQTEDQYIYIHKLLTEHLDRPRTPDLLQNQSPIYENQSIINGYTGERKNKLQEEVAESKF